MAGVAFAVEGDGVGFATESYAASALYATLANLLAALWRIRRARLSNGCGYCLKTRCTRSPSLRTGIMVRMMMDGATAALQGDGAPPLCPKLHGCAVSLDGRTGSLDARSPA